METIKDKLELDKWILKIEINGMVVYEGGRRIMDKLLLEEEELLKKLEGLNPSNEKKETSI